MFRIRLTALAAAAVLALGVSAASAEPPPTELLFKLRQLDLVSKGSEISYSFERKTTNEALLGKDYTEKLRLEITRAKDKGVRDVAMHVFSGEAARDVQNWPDLSTNPLFLWYLDRSVAQLASLSGSEKMYLKGRIRGTFDEKGKVESIKVAYGGKDVEAYKIVLKPLKGDPAADKMEGYDYSVLSFVVSDAVPGYFVEMASTFESPRRGTPIVKETLKFENAGETK